MAPSTTRKRARWCTDPGNLRAFGVFHAEHRGPLAEIGDVGAGQSLGRTDEPSGESAYRQARQAPRPSRGDPLIHLRAELLTLEAIATRPDLEAGEDDAEIHRRRDAVLLAYGILDEVVEVEGQAVYRIRSHVRDA